MAFALLTRYVAEFEENCQNNEAIFLRNVLKLHWLDQCMAFAIWTRFVAEFKKISQAMRPHSSEIFEVLKLIELWSEMSLPRVSYIIAFNLTLKNP